MLSAKFDAAIPTDHFFVATSFNYPKVTNVKFLALFPEVLCAPQTGIFLHYRGNSFQKCVQFMAYVAFQIAII